MIRCILPMTLAATMVGGCTVPIHLPADEICRTDEVMAYTAQPYSKRIGKIVKAKTRAAHLRVITPGMATTMEFNAKRANIVIDHRNRITRIYCG